MNISYFQMYIDGEPNNILKLYNTIINRDTTKPYMHYIHYSTIPIRVDNVYMMTGICNWSVKESMLTEPHLPHQTNLQELTKALNLVIQCYDYTPSTNTENQYIIARNKIIQETTIDTKFINTNRYNNVLELNFDNNTNVTLDQFNRPTTLLKTGGFDDWCIKI